MYRRTIVERPLADGRILGIVPQPHGSVLVIGTPEGTRAGHWERAWCFLSGRHAVHWFLRFDGQGEPEGYLHTHERPTIPFLCEAVLEAVCEDKDEH